MPTNQPNYWKLGVFAAIAAGLFLYGRSCGINSVLKTAGQIKEVKKDSFIFVDRPVPYRVDVPYPVPGKPIPYIVTKDGVPQIIIEPTDTASILADYNSTAYYDERIPYRAGWLDITDTVTRNRIAGRGRKITWGDTTVTNTIVLRPPRRLVGYLDLAAMGGRHDFGASAGFSLKLPSDRVYGVGVSYLWNGGVVYYGRASVPIRFKR